ncbi:ABC transporter substrate-binding protein [Clostridium sardiniense]|uniref:ABC transporter substrate-binding protein n=1 Tax=Clostridium sardiniense TaxID=29369 RepID=A0ABS7L0Z8_CLOSR|nr:ABC transporter substrate-binding protein [Clostridium sardiniense]MBY0756746.1 ABC transporter substrate-binding protein [Clostridium sardiniense]MDQ0460431.1 iron complex transport system substrate-binding protein [Clostridium sardiniense]
MKNKGLKKLIVILMALTLTMSLVACGGSNKKEEAKGNSSTSEDKSNGDSHYPVTITTYDFAGNEIKETFDKAPERVVTTNQTATELMLDLGLGDKLVGTCYLDNPILGRLKDQYSKVKVLSDKYPTKEQVLSLKPDLIFGWKSVFAPKELGDVKEWQDRGVNTLVQRNTVKTVGNFTVDNLYKDINDIGLIFNIQDKTNEYVKNLKDRLKTIEDKTSKLKDKKKVLILEESKEGQFRVYGKNDLVSDMVEKAGAVNIEDKSGTISTEGIVAANPDAIIYIHSGDGKESNSKELAKVFTDNKALKNVTAVKDNNIVVTGLAETWAGGVRVVDAIEQYSKELYPELYK